MSSEIGGIGGFHGNIVPIGGNPKSPTVDDQQILEEVNRLPLEISITDDQANISPDREIPRDPHHSEPADELLQRIEDEEFGPSIGASAAASAVEGAREASGVGLSTVVTRSDDRTDLEITVDGRERRLSFSDDELQISVEEGVARIPLNADDGDIQITIERPGQEDDITIEVSEDIKDLVDTMSSEGKNIADEAREKNPDEKRVHLMSHPTLEQLIKAFEELIERYRHR